LPIVKNKVINFIQKNLKLLNQTIERYSMYFKQMLEIDEALQQLHNFQSSLRAIIFNITHSVLLQRLTEDRAMFYFIFHFQLRMSSPRFKESY
jgi:hypothetical protein